MISVLCPTRNRPGSVRRLLDSIRDTAEGSIEPVFYCDDDDPELLAVTQIVHEFSGGVLLTGPRITLSQMWNECYEASSQPVVMQCGDDIVFRTHGWDYQVAQAFAQYPDGVALVYGNDGLHGQELATHGFVTRTWVEAAGHFTPSQFSSDYGDKWLHDVAAALGRLHYLPEVYTEHLHPAAGKGAWDQTHLERLERHRRDDVSALYVQLAPERARDVEALRKVMR